MTITKEQVRESFAKHYPKDLPLIELAENNKEFWMDALGARHHLTAFELGYTAGAEAKLAELLAGVEMPEPYATLHHDDGYFTTKQREHDLRYSGPMRTDVVTLTQLQTAVAAAVAKKEAEIVTAKYNEDTWYGRFMKAAQKAHEFQREIAVLKAERDALAGAVVKKDAECDTITEMNHAQWLALENVRMLASRNANEEWAQHMLRFCASAGGVPNPLRVAKVDALTAERDALKGELDKCVAAARAAREATK